MHSIVFSFSYSCFLLSHIYNYSKRQQTLGRLSDELNKLGVQRDYNEIKTKMKNMKMGYKTAKADGALSRYRFKNEVAKVFRLDRELKDLIVHERNDDDDEEEDYDDDGGERDDSHDDYGENEEIGIEESSGTEMGGRQHVTLSTEDSSYHQQHPVQIEFGKTCVNQLIVRTSHTHE
jgi:hypothetical protein